MSDIILHHYPQSPVAEKVRVGLGVKKLAWRSVQIPRVPPKPDLMPLTGGYRRTPVMQIGADIYCDSQCILWEIDRRHPEPTFYPGGGQGMPWVLSRWSDAILFDQIVRIVLGYSLPTKCRPSFWRTAHGSISVLIGTWRPSRQACRIRWRRSAPSSAGSMSACPTAATSSWSSRASPMCWFTISCGSCVAAGRAVATSCRSFPRWRPGRRV